jgi:hypothetical protein
MLRRRRSSESEFAFPNQHQVSDVNKGVGEIRHDSNRIAPEDKVDAHQRASRDAPIPKRDWDNAFALSLRREPLDKETHREKSVPNKTEDHEITPIQSKKPVFFSDPGNSDECNCVHKARNFFTVSPLASQATR